MLMILYQGCGDPRARATSQHRIQERIIQHTMTNVRTVMGSMEWMPSSPSATRSPPAAQCRRQGDRALGVKRPDRDQDINPPRDLVDSMARQMKAEREKTRQHLEAEGFARRRPQGEGREAAVVLQAEGRREAAFRDAEAARAFGRAEAKAPKW